MTETPAAPPPRSARDLDFQDLAELTRCLADQVRALAERGLCPGTGGNFSLVVSHAPLRLLMTPSGADKRTLAPGDLLLVGEDGQPRPERREGGGPESSPAVPAARPSAETLLHVALAEEAGAGAVLHTHSVANTLLGEHFRPRGGFSITGYEMLKGIRGNRTHEGRLFVPVLANSQDMPALAAEIRQLVRDQPGLYGLLLAGHGLYAWGESLEEATRHLEVFEFLFECVLRRTSLAPFDEASRPT